MDKPQIHVHDALTGQTIVRNMTDEEAAALAEAQAETPPEAPK